jgi:hypothetical protein
VVEVEIKETKNDQLKDPEYILNQSQKKALRSYYMHAMRSSTASKSSTQTSKMARLSQLKMEETPRAKDVILLKRENRDHYLLALPNIAEAANFDAESKIYSEHAKKYLEEIKIAQ